MFFSYVLFLRYGPKVEINLYFFNNCVSSQCYEAGKEENRKEYNSIEENSFGAFCKAFRSLFFFGEGIGKRKGSIQSPDL